MNVHYYYITKLVPNINDVLMLGDWIQSLLKFYLITRVLESIFAIGKVGEFQPFLNFFSNFWSPVTVDYYIFF